MEADSISFNYLTAIFIGWFMARAKYTDLMTEEQNLHVTLATQTLYLNGMGEISGDEFDIHGRVAKRIEELANADPHWLLSQGLVKRIE